jgi:hypothetical protein
MKKRVVVLQHNGGRLANQLWLFMSVYAYCLEKGYQCRNYSFFEYAKHFPAASGGRFFGFFVALYGFFEPANRLLRSGYRYMFRKAYALFVLSVRAFRGGSFVYAPDDSDNPSIQRLPPTPGAFSDVLAFDADPHRRMLYMVGWLFRNSAGIEKFRDRIRSCFRPKEKHMLPIEAQMKKIRNVYDMVVGVHIRKGDYRTYRKGELFFSEREIAAMLRDFMQKNRGKNLCFLAFSDEKIDWTAFAGLPMLYPENPVNSDIRDLFQLSMADAIIGSDSTFGGFASYYGNVPFIIFQRNGIDWSLYEGKQAYFENTLSVTNRY